MAKLRKWPYGFLDEFWDYDTDEAPGITNDAELAGSLEYVLATAKITDQDRDVLYRHYKYGETYKSIAAALELSPSRIAEISRKAMRRIRTHPKNRAILSMGVAAFSRRMVEIKQTEEFQTALAEKVKEVRLADARYWASKYGLPTEPGEKPKKKAKAPKPKDMLLEDMNLSVRAYNGLRRSGHSKASDILAHGSREELLNIRGMGEGSVKEILSELEKNGYDTRHLCA